MKISNFLIFHESSLLQRFRLVIGLSLFITSCGVGNLPWGQATPEDARFINIVPRGSESGISTQLQVEAGEDLHLQLARNECCYAWVEIEANVGWSLAKPVQGVSIDADSGLLHVQDDVANGTSLRVVAWVGTGQKFEEDVTVFTAEANPFVGIWQEVAQLSCETEEELGVLDPIRELVFYADGSMRITWFPFEIYVDYGGEYRFADGSLTLVPREILYLPQFIDPTGSYSFEDAGRLVLSDLWLGTPPNRPNAPVNCGHIFAPR